MVVEWILNEKIYLILKNILKDIKNQSFISIYRQIHFMVKIGYLILTK